MENISEKSVDKDKILILYNSVDYFFHELKKRGYHISYLYRNEKFLNRAGRKIMEKLSQKKTLLYGSWKNKISNYSLVVIFAPVEQQVIEYIKQKNPLARIVYWYWNPAYRIGRPSLFLEENTELWTFDKDDAERYKMKYNNTFYPDTIRTEAKDPELDILFVGRTKHRGEKLNEYKKQFEAAGLTIYFYIVPTLNERKPDSPRELEYQEYLDLISRSGAILDTMPPSQIGLTIRPMESLFLQKKLVTDNIHIKDEPFYKADNIFILGKDNPEGLKDFLERPYIPVEKEIAGRYDFDEWIKRIAENREFGN